MEADDRNFEDKVKKDLVWTEYNRSVYVFINLIVTKNLSHDRKGFTFPMVNATSLHIAIFRVVLVNSSSFAISLCFVFISTLQMSMGGFLRTIF